MQNIFNILSIYKFAEPKTFAYIREMNMQQKKRAALIIALIIALLLLMLMANAPACDLDCIIERARSNIKIN